MKKSNKTGKAGKSFFKQPANIAVILLSVALLVVGLVSLVYIHNLKTKTKTEMDNAKIAVFEDLADEFIRNQDLVSEDMQIFSEKTGYGISDEDGVFYITFDYYLYSLDEDGQPVTDEVRHSIVYFWPDEERGGYSHAYSYHDDANYHPAGEYYRLER